MPWSEPKPTLRRSLLLMLLWAFFAGPAFAYTATADAACEQVSMAGGCCGGEHEKAANACTVHCFAPVAILASPATLPSRAAIPPALATPSLAVVSRVTAPDTGPPKA
ncbi:MAG TPA: hypothetical protein VFV74_08970 [Burkholderiales bacterium]|nr:hypothetical protein [Burkholderiales bacterium]